MKAEKPDIYPTIPKTNLQTFVKRNVKSQVQTKKGEVDELRNDAKFIVSAAYWQSVNLDRLIMKNLMSYNSRKFPAFHVARVDFVNVRYPEVSVKRVERNKRAVSGATQIRIGGPSQKVPRQFKKFLGLGENKESLVEFIFKHLCTMQLEENLCNLSLYFSHGQKCHRFYVDKRNAARVEEIPELYSDHEEADTRLPLHAKHALIVYQAITVRSPDKDVFILMLGHKRAIDAALYFDTGSGNQRRVLDIDKCYGELGSSLCDALIGFHAFTGIFRNYNKIRKLLAILLPGRVYD